MALLEVRCNKCGSLFQADPEFPGPVVCSRCQQEVPRKEAFSGSAARPMPRVSVAGAVPMPSAMPRPQVNGAPPAAAVATEEEGLDEGEPSAIQAAISEAFPWAMSIAFHLAVLLLLTFITCFAEAPHKGMAARVDDDPADETKMPTHLIGDSLTPGSPVVTGHEGIEGYGKGKDIHDFSGADTAISDAGTAGGGKDQGFIDVAVAVPSGGTSSGGTGDGTGVGAAGLGNILGSGHGGGKGGKFFGTGLPRRGVMRVVYVVDNSGSMNTNFDYVKVELKRSISELQPRQQFHVIMFSDGPADEMKINGQVKLTYATAANEEAAYKWIDQKYAASTDGKTLPEDSFRHAFSARGDKGDKVELIYVLTDGLFPNETLDYLHNANKDKKVMINTIAFCDREGEVLMKKIAEENGGVYKFVKDTDLGKDYSTGN